MAKVLQPPRAEQVAPEMWVGLVPYGLPGEDEGGDARFGSSAGSVRMLGGWVVAGQRAQPCAASVGRERWGRTAELHPGGQSRRHFF